VYSKQVPIIIILFPRARTGPILTSPRTGCKSTLFSRSFLCLLQHHKLYKNNGHCGVAMLYVKRRLEALQ